MALDQVDVDNMKEEDEMSFLEHLEALRWHLVRSVIALLVFAIVIFIAKDFTMFILTWPKEKGFPTYQLFCQWEATCFYPPDFTFDLKAPTESFLTHIRVSVVFALMLTFPYIFWELWRFIKPALHRNELKAARGIVFSCSSLFIAGISFGYFVICPFAITFLANYEFMVSAENFEPNLSEYVSSIIIFTFPTGIVFQLPVAVYFLSKIGLVTPEFLKKYRRHSIIIILILAAIVTPPDVVTQFLIGIPLFMLYEVSIIISRRVIKNSEAKEKREMISK